MQYLELLHKGVSPQDEQFRFVSESLTKAIAMHNEELRKKTMETNKQLTEQLKDLQLNQEMFDLYIVRKELAEQSQAQLPDQVGQQPQAAPARPPSPTPITVTPEGTDEEEIPMLMAEAMGDFATDNIEARLAIEARKWAGVTPFLGLNWSKTMNRTSPEDYEELEVP